MGVKLHIEVEGPLGPADKEILTGATMILLSLAGQFAEPEEPLPCGDLEYDFSTVPGEATGRVCVSEVGHKGRHKYREPVPLSAGGLN